MSTKSQYAKTTKNDIVVCELRVDIHSDGLGTILNFKIPSVPAYAVSQFELTKNVALAKRCIEMCPESYRWFPDILKKDGKVAMKAVLAEPKLLAIVPKDVVTWNWVYDLVVKDGKFLGEVPDDYSDDFQIVEAALESCPYAIVYASIDVLEEFDIDSDDVYDDHNFSRGWTRGCCCCDQDEGRGNFTRNELKVLQNPEFGTLANVVDIAVKKVDPDVLIESVRNLQMAVVYAKWSAKGREVLKRISEE